MAKKAPTSATRQEIQHQSLALTQRGTQRLELFVPRIAKVAQVVLLSTALGVLPAQSMAADAWGNNNILIPEMGTAGALGITVQREMAIGDYFLRTARSMLPVVDDPVLNEYVSTLGQRLLSHADNVQFPFDFFVVKNDTLNASAFLGGKVVIHTGLFTYAETEDEFASVLAHEISHVTQRHIARFIEGMTRRGHDARQSALNSWCGRCYCHDHLKSSCGYGSDLHHHGRKHAKPHQLYP